MAIVLRYFVDLSMRDTAAAMRCPEETVKTLTFQAIQLLRTRGVVEPEPLLEVFYEGTAEVFFDLAKLTAQEHGAEFVPIEGLGDIDAFIQREKVAPAVRGFLNHATEGTPKRSHRETAGTAARNAPLQLDDVTTARPRTQG